MPQTQRVPAVGEDVTALMGVVSEPRRENQQPAVGEDVTALMAGTREDGSAPPPPRPTWADSLGLNEGTDSRLVGFLRGSGGAVVDMAQGAAAEATKRLRENKGQQIFDSRKSPRIPQELHRPPSEPIEAPKTMAGTIGTMAPMAAELAMPAGAAKSAVGLRPTVVKAGAKFQDVMSAAKAIPIETKVVGDAALRVQQLAERGATMPQPVRKLLLRMTDPAKAPMAYEEARDFASNISRLSVNDFNRLSPVMAKEVANLRVALNEANAQAAKLAGKGAEYKSAMREYSQAMRLKNAIDTSIAGVKRAAAPAAAGGLAYWLTGKVRAAITGAE